MDIAYERESVRRGDRCGWRGDSLHRSHTQQLYLWDHDHPIPRRLNMRSRASRRTFGMVNGRSIGAACWPSTGGLYLLSGCFAIVQARDLSTTPNNQPWAASSVRKKETMFDDKIAPPTPCSSGRAWPNFRIPMSFPTRRTRLAPLHISKPATERWERGQVLK
jgi:hypothetical protein